jgi:hypothetical protein
MPNFFVATAELAKDVQRIDSSQSHDRQEPAKAKCQRQARVKKHAI